MKNKYASQITFLYYDNLEIGSNFYQNLMGMPLIEDQGFAQIFRVSEHAFVGVVDGKKGFLKTQPKNAVMLTFCVEDVEESYQHLKDHGVKMLSQPEMDEEMQIMSFFFEDPGGYTLEMQKFFDPRLAVFFHQQD